MNQCTEQQFLKDVADHKMTVLHDDRVHRCVRFGRKDDYFVNHFTLTTWPWHLCISGDMGTFVFSRVEDMFTFFRCTHESELHINPSYWGEKCEAADRRTGGMDVYDEENFKAAVGRYFNNHDFENDNEKKACWQQIKDEVLIAENEHEAHSFAGEFKFEAEHDSFEFSDFWEADLRSWSYQYIWCLYAIVWGIKQYDGARVFAEVSNG